MSTSVGEIQQLWNNFADNPKLGRMANTLNDFVTPGLDKGVLENSKAAPVL